MKPLSLFKTRHFFLAVFCLLFVFSSCQKKSEFTSVNTITATVDGVDVRFNKVATAHYANILSAQYAPTLVINGATATTSIVITVTSPRPVTDTTYISSDTGNVVPSCDMVYYPAQPEQYYITNNFATGSTTVTITSITNNNVTGTFSGTLVYFINGDPTPPKIITNGKFNLKIN
ncbi:MAG TPA: hypothetical protein VHB54_09460 [Mucilaginibacter sp.]|nr:hypothetical protein [Mucilaginibacter sp.]